MNNTVILKSEYQQQFVGDKDGTFTSNYENMVKIRTQRMSYERSHTPLVWMDKEEENKSPKRNKKPGAEIERPKTAAPTLVSKISTDTSSTPKVSPVKVSKEIEKENPKRSQSAQTCFETKTIDVGVQSPQRNRPWIKRKLHRKPLKPKQPTLIQEKPIIAYGWADDSSIQKKRTYNVKAPISDVRPTALQAAKRREKHLRGLISKKERMVQERLKTQALIDTLTNFEQWQTEYQKEFCKK